MSTNARISTWRALVGPCNICGVESRLTQDHIPPKGVIRPRQMEIMSLTDLLSVDRPRRSTRLLQDGVKFRTICPDCNNNKLGHRYDPSLIAFANDVRQYLLNRAGLLLPQQTLFHVKAQRLCRAVVGHLLAHGTEPPKGPVASALSAYFLDEGASFPSGIQLYYWVYPYPDQVALRGFAFSSHLWEGMTTGMLLKFFPLAFLFVTDSPRAANDVVSRLDRLDTTLASDIDSESRLVLRFHDLPQRRWPECPADTTMVLHGAGAVAAFPRAA